MPGFLDCRLSSFVLFCCRSSTHVMLLLPILNVAKGPQMRGIAAFQLSTPSYCKNSGALADC